MQIGWGSWSKRAARVAHLANVDVPPDPGRIRFYPRMRNPSIPLQRQQTGDENRDRPGRYDPAPCGNPKPHCLVADRLGLMEPARGESCPSGQRRGPAAPGEDKFPSPDQKSLHTSTTSTTQGQKRRSPGSIPPRRVWTPQPHGAMADCRGSWSQRVARVAPRANAEPGS